LDIALEDDDQWFNAVSDLEGDPFTHLFDEFGNLKKKKKPLFIVLSPKTTVVSKETHTLNKVVLWNGVLGAVLWTVGDGGN